MFLRYSPPSHPEKFTFKYFPQKISTHKKVSQLRADLRSTMTSNSAVDTDAINNKAAGEYFVVPSWNKHVNTIIQLLSPSVNVCTAPTDAALYLPDNIVVDVMSTVHHSDLNDSLYMIPTTQNTTRYSCK